jgi:ankyrin repeat protein
MVRVLITAKEHLMRAVIGACLVGLTLGLSPAPAVAADRETRLPDAVQRRDSAAVKELLKQSADANARQADGATALAWAAHWDDLELATALLKAGADVKAADDLGMTPLALACTNGSAAMARLLLTAGAEPNRARKSGETPLMTAAFTGSLELVQTLLSHRADVNAVVTEGKQTALMWATSEKHPAIVKALVAAGADVNARTTGGFSALLFAARQGDTESGGVLLDAGADPNDRARDNSTALVVAVASGREEMALLLLERGADPNLAEGGYTALHAAVPKDLRKTIKALLMHGADPNVRLKTASPALFGPGRGAGSEVQPTAAQAKPAMAGAGSLSGVTPFWLAARNVNVEAMRILHEGGADATLANDSLTTPLMVAAGLTQIQGPRVKRGDVSQFYSNWNAADSLDSLKYLVGLGADVNARNASGQTALHGAAYMGGNPVVEFLLERGATLNAQDAQGQTPYRIAEGHLNTAAQGVSEWPETAALLRSKGADTTLGVDGRTMLRQYVNLKDSTGQGAAAESRPR